MDRWVRGYELGGPAGQSAAVGDKHG